jgi:hypothetical protein
MNVGHDYPKRKNFIDKIKGPTKTQLRDEIRCENLSASGYLPGKNPKTKNKLRLFLVKNTMTSDRAVRASKSSLKLSAATPLTLEARANASLLASSTYAEVKPASDNLSLNLSFLERSARIKTRLGFIKSGSNLKVSP